MNHHLKFKYYLLSLFIAVATFYACDKDNPLPSPDQPAVATGPIELPALRGNKDYPLLTHKVKIQNKDSVVNYYIEYSRKQKHLHWVAFRFDDQTAIINSKRMDPWADDPQLPAEDRSVREDFSGYDRGHICASHDRRFSQDANDQTFYYSNMSPQINNFNAGIWAALEGQIQNWGRNSAFRDTLYIAKGGTIDRAEDILTYAKGPNKLPVPKYYYMAVLCRKNDIYKAIGFWMEHKTYSKPYNLRVYAMPVRDLERLTGLDFFHHLPAKLQDAVETQMDVNKWSGL